MCERLYELIINPINSDGTPAFHDESGRAYLEYHKFSAFKEVTRIIMGLSCWYRNIDMDSVHVCPVPIDLNHSIFVVTICLADPLKNIPYTETQEVDVKQYKVPVIDENRQNQPVVQATIQISQGTKRPSLLR